MKKPGDRIGKYVVEEHLGSGGNGAVYVARDDVLGRRVALKLLHPQLAFESGFAGRFRAEASAMARLNHPNVVTVHDFVGEGQTWAIVMELVEGGQTLATLIAREGKLTPKRALAIGRQVAAGLGHAHARGIVHRDVKPANVMIVRDGATERAKVTDFGIALLTGGERFTHESMTLGTLYYLAPEQAQGSTVDPRADVYSFGASLYEALTGRVPFLYSNAAQVLAAHVTEAAMPPSSYTPGVPAELDRLVASCLAKRPNERPRDGDAVAEWIQRIEAEAAYPITTRPPPPDPSVQVVPPTGGMPVAQPPPPAFSSMRQPPPAFGPPPAAPAAFGGAAAAVSSSDDSRNALWVTLGILLLLASVCVVGGFLGCITCLGAAG